MDHIDNGAEVCADILSALPANKAYVLVGFGCFAIRFGPYPPAELGGFIERLMDGHQGPHPFMFTLECNDVEDPVPLLLDLARPDEEPSPVDADSAAA